MKRVELLAPAGNMEKLEMAFHYGADAVFLGGSMFNLRAGSHNFSDEQLIEAVKYAHSMEKKVYVALNVIPHGNEFALLPSYVKFLEKIGVNGVIVADLGVFQIVQENSSLPISISTQASNTNWRSVKLWKEMGARRVVLAREISLENIAEIRAKVPDIEIEVFVHGAMCMAVSGRCILSNNMTGRDANRGDCAQSCRWNYSVDEENMEGDEIADRNSDGYSFIFNSKDLCTIKIIDKLLDIGVDSLKIEGRMKGIYYVANVVKVYKDALNSYYSPEGFRYNPQWMEELESTSHRSYSTGFLENKPTSAAMNYRDRNSYSQSHQLVAKVIEKLSDTEYKLAIRNRLLTGEKLEVINPTFGIETITLPEMRLVNKNHEEVVTAANPNSTVIVTIEDAQLDVFDMIRKRIG